MKYGETSGWPPSTNIRCNEDMSVLKEILWKQVNYNHTYCLWILQQILSWPAKPYCVVLPQVYHTSLGPPESSETSPDLMRMCCWWTNTYTWPVDKLMRIMNTCVCMLLKKHFSRRITKPTKWQVRPANTQISLGICPVWSVFTVCMKKAWATHWVHSKDSDQTGQMPRLIWVFTGRKATLLVFSCRGSFVIV